MAKLIRILNWSRHYEKNRTREVKNMVWTPIPNRFDGDRISELIAETGAAGYGAWCAMLHVAGRCEPRGTLIRSSGVPHDEESLKRMTGLEKAAFVKAIDVAQRIGLVEVINLEESTLFDTSQEGATRSQASATIEKNRGEENRGEENTSGLTAKLPLSWSAEYGWQGVSEELRESWKAAYPACNISVQLAQMNQWLLANPEKAAKKRWGRFVTNWLKRHQDRGGDIRSKPIGPQQEVRLYGKR